VEFKSYTSGRAAAVLKASKNMKSMITTLKVVLKFWDYFKNTHIK